MIKVLWATPEEEKIKPIRDMYLETGYSGMHVPTFWEKIEDKYEDIRENFASWWNRQHI